jgi:hypothetical protein
MLFFMTLATKGCRIPDSRARTFQIRAAFMACYLALSMPAFSQTDTATITVGNLNLGNIDRVVLQGPSSPFVYSAPTYQDQTFYVVYRPGFPNNNAALRGQPVGIPARPVRVMNQGAQVTGTNITHVNLRFTATNWNTVPASATVTLALGATTMTMKSGATDVVFLDVPHTTLPLSVTANGTETVGGKPIPVVVPGILPVKVTCPIIGTIRPHYYLLSVLYAPPGTNGGRSSSQVEYSAGSSTGATTSANSMFAQGLDIKAEAGGGIFSSATLNADFSSTGTAGDSTSLDIKKTQTGNYRIPGPAADGIDHDYDEFLLWLNPIVNVTVDATNNAQWQMGTFGDGPMIIQPVYAAYLKNPTLMASQDPGLKSDLDAAGITPDEYKQILKANPFTDPDAKVPVAINLNRFLPVSTGSTFDYNPPLTPQDSVPVRIYSQSNSVTNTAIKTVEVDTKTSFGLTVSIGALDVFHAKVTTTATFDWKSTASRGQSSGSTQSASFTIGGPSFGYKDKVDVVVYWDSVYNSFMFAFNSDPTTKD